MQQTFEQWLKGLAGQDLARVEDEIHREASERNEAVDYEELEHEAQVTSEYVADIEASWSLYPLKAA